MFAVYAECATFQLIVFRAERIVFVGVSGERHRRRRHD